MPIEVEVPDIGIVEFPEGTKEEDILSQLGKAVPSFQSQLSALKGAQVGAEAAQRAQAGQLPIIADPNAVARPTDEQLAEAHKKNLQRQLEAARIDTSFNVDPETGKPFQAANIAGELEKAPGKEMSQLGRLAVGNLADVGAFYTGDKSFANTKQVLEEGMLPEKTAPLPTETERRFLPAPLAAAEAGVQGIVQTTPQLVASILAPEAAPFMFGMTPEGFDPKQAAFAVALPYIGRYSGEVAGVIAKKLGISSANAINLVKAGAAGGGPAAAIIGDSELQIRNQEKAGQLTPEEAHRARIDAYGNALAMGVLGITGTELERGGKPPSDKIPVTWREIQKGEANASQVKEAAKVYGNVPPQPGSGEREVSIGKGGGGIQSQAEGRVPEAAKGEVPLTKEEREFQLLHENWLPTQVPWRQEFLKKEVAKGKGTQDIETNFADANDIDPRATERAIRYYELAQKLYSRDKVPPEAQAKEKLSTEGLGRAAAAAVSAFNKSGNFTDAVSAYRQEFIDAGQMYGGDAKSERTVRRILDNAKRAPVESSAKPKMKPMSPLDRKIQEAEGELWAKSGAAPGVLDMLRDEASRRNWSDEQYLKALEDADTRLRASKATKLTEAPAVPAPKEGMTRLYRGHDGKEAGVDWSDSPEVAANYGPQMHYVDVPTSEIGKSIKPREGSGTPNAYVLPADMTKAAKPFPNPPKAKVIDLEAEPVKPTAKTPDEIAALPQSEFYDYVKAKTGGLTGEAYRVGQGVKSMEEVNALKAAMESAAQKSREALAKKDLNAAAEWGMKGQFFREAYEAATGTGSAGFSLSKDPSYKPPFPIKEPVEPKAVSEPKKKAAPKEGSVRSKAKEFDSIILNYAPQMEWSRNPDLLYQNVEKQSQPGSGIIKLRMMKSKEMQIARRNVARDLGLDFDSIGGETYRAENLEKLKKFIAERFPEEAQKKEFEAAIKKGDEKVPVSQVNVGDVLTIDGEKATVTQIDPDNGDVTLDDGKRFGTQTLEDGTMILADEWKQTEGSTEFAPAEEQPAPKVEAPKPEIAKSKTEIGKVDKAINELYDKKAAGEKLTPSEEARLRELENRRGQQDLLEAQNSPELLQKQYDALIEKAQELNRQRVLAQNRAMASKVPEVQDRHAADARQYESEANQIEGQAYEIKRQLERLAGDEEATPAAALPEEGGGQQELIGMGGALAGAPGGKPELAQLNDALKTMAQQNPKPKLQDAYTLGERYSQIKSKAQSAVSGLKAVGKYMAMRLKGLPTWNGLKDALGERQVSLTESVMTARRFMKDALRGVPKPLDREAISDYVDAGGSDDVLRTALAETKDRYKPGYQRALNLPPELKTLADNIKNYFDARLQDAIDAGILEDGIEDYIHRLYPKDTPWKRGVIAEIRSGVFTGKPSLAKKRVFQYDYEAERAGYEPVKDFAQRVANYDLSLNKAIADRRFVKELMQWKMDDGKPAIASAGIGKKTPGSGADSAYLIKPAFKDGKAVTGDDRPYIPYEHPALRKWKWLGEDDSGRTIMLQGDVLVHPDALGRINAIFGKSKIRQYALGRGALATGAVIKGTMLDLSGFHPVQITVHGWEHRTFKPIEEIDLSDPSQRALVKHGLVVADMHGAQMFSEGSSGPGSILHYIPKFGPRLVQYNHWLFQDYIPRLKMAMALHALERNRARFTEQLRSGKMTEDQLLHLTAEQANAAFGELNYEMMGRNKTVQDALRIALLAPDFLEARGKFAGQAFTKYGKEQRAALVLGAATLYITARIINKLLDGQYHFELRNAFSVVYGKKAYSLRTVQGDLLHLVTDWQKFTSSRLNPVFGRTMFEAMTHRDPFGRTRTFTEQLKDLGKTIVPITARGILDKREQTLIESFLNAMGITERRDTSNDEVYRLAGKWKEKHGVGQPGEFIYDPDKDPYRRIKLALVFDTPRAAAQEMSLALKNKSVNIKQMADYLRKYGTTPFTGSRRNDIQFYDSLSADQKKTYDDAVKERQEIRAKLPEAFQIWRDNFSDVQP